ncbi:ER-Golgi vesicle protein transport Sft2 [Mycena chlorophos]|uniref:hydroxyacylglutathione hydrolase n=1 Tax=Mycena chlorophos TaxID=658473 RepID=A0A8H6TTM1_MYCCL|nr:ER-Golgi vesicle protein transport Sft2 [Mycena chlorophos]
MAVTTSSSRKCSQVVPVLSGDHCAYVLFDEAKTQAIAVDPLDVEAIKRTVGAVKLVAVLTTHHHHGRNNVLFAVAYPDAQIYAGSARSSNVAHIVQHDEVLSLGNGLHIRCISTPCHTQDSVCFYVTDALEPAQPGVVFTGDTLFVAGCGRFLEGKAEDMRAALQSLASLPDETRLYSGHNNAEANLWFAKAMEPDNLDIDTLNEIVENNQVIAGLTTMGDEKKWNPFMRLKRGERSQSLGFDSLEQEASISDKIAALRRALDTFEGTVKLVLSPTNHFYLRIPIFRIQANCLSPVKYLLYLGWCILGQLGSLKYNREDDHVLAQEDAIEPYRTYYFVPENETDDAFEFAVDMDVIAACSTFSTTSSRRETAFKDTLVGRDAMCVFTGASLGFAEGMHIIHKEDEWFSLIVDNRSAIADEGEDLPTDINGSENGLLVFKAFNTAWDLHKYAILKTPNAILDTSDIPAAPHRKLYGTVEYPVGARYTLQWFSGTVHDQGLLPNNSDAAFKRNIQPRVPLPSSLLTHYVYGASAVKQWGHGLDELSPANRPNLSRPKQRAETRKKRDRANSDEEESARRRRERSEAQCCDAEYAVLLLSARAPEATARRRQIEEESQMQLERARISVEEWRNTVL